MAEKVASLTTIGTPHPAPFWDDRIIVMRRFVDRFSKKVGQIDLEVFQDLTTAACGNLIAGLDAELEQSFYQVFSSFQGARNMFLPIVPSWSLSLG
jgi:hypothetical protein